MNGDACTSVPCKTMKPATASDDAFVIISFLPKEFCLVFDSLTPSYAQTVFAPEELRSARLWSTSGRRVRWSERIEPRFLFITQGGIEIRQSRTHGLNGSRHRIETF